MSTLKGLLKGKDQEKFKKLNQEITFNEYLDLVK